MTMLKEIVIPMLIAFGIGLVLGPPVIAYLRKKKAGQTEREELQSHQKKTGTPTMGGIIILAAVLVTGCLYIPSARDILPVEILTVGFGLIGFIDDYLKVMLHRTDGLFAWQKLLLQIVVTTGFVCYILFVSDVGLWMRIPFSQKTIGLGGFAIPLLYFAVIGTVNGTNFTDGLDGLASSVTVIVAGFFTAAAVWLDTNGFYALGRNARGAFYELLSALALKGLIRLDFDLPLGNFDYAMYAPYPHRGSVALTAAGQNVIELLDVQGAEE